VYDVGIKCCVSVAWFVNFPQAVRLIALLQIYSSSLFIHASPLPLFCLKDYARFRLD
jgi:hypothetical protein